MPLDFALRESDPLYSRKLPCWSRDGQSKVGREGGRREEGREGGIRRGIGEPKARREGGGEGRNERGKELTFFLTTLRPSPPPSTTLLPFTSCHPNHLTPYHVMPYQVKRLRLCVSDNENMRAAFSLLRYLPPFLPPSLPPSLPPPLFYLYLPTTHSSPLRRLFLPPLPPHFSSFLLALPSPLPPSPPPSRVMMADEEELVRMLGPGNMFKTARDITYPVRWGGREGGRKGGREGSRWSERSNISFACRRKKTRKTREKGGKEMRSRTLILPPSLPPSPSSLRNEARVLQSLLAKVTDALSAYPTRLEDDQAALARQDDPSLRPFSNRRHALIQVGREGGGEGGAR